MQQTLNVSDEVTCELELSRGIIGLGCGERKEKVSFFPFSRADKTDGYAYLRANRANNKGRSNERLLPYGFWQIVCGDGGFV